MHKSALTSTGWQAKPADQSAPKIRTSANAGPWLLAAGLLIAYALPWLVTNSAALTFGGYDLAEWSSLPPAARTTEPALLAALLLRLVLTCITLYFALATSYRRGQAGWWVSLMAVGLLSVAQLPPLEYFSIARNDSNYGQQFALAVFSLALGLVILLSPQGSWRNYVAAVVALVGALAGYTGAMHGLELMRGYRIEANMGGGVWLSVALFAIAALLSLLRTRRDNKKSSVL